MISRNNSVILVFNGEIYNFNVLRNELESYGVSFQSHSDTEVILKGYLEWGFDKIISKLNGMFSIAIVDKNKECVFLARDHAGIKPLFFSNHNNSFIFCSELNPINEYLGINQNENLDYSAL